MLPAIDLKIEEATEQYNFSFTNYSLNFLITNLQEITRDDNTSTPFSSLTLIKLNIQNSKICSCYIKTLGNSAEDELEKFIKWQNSATLVAIKLSNCYVTHNMACKLASIITEIANLKLFELSYSYIQEYNLEEIIKALKSTESMKYFAIKSINCFNEDIVRDIASIIGRNNEINHLEISNCNFQYTMALTIIA